MASFGNSSPPDSSPQGIISNGHSDMSKEVFMPQSMEIVDEEVQPLDAAQISTTANKLEQENLILEQVVQEAPFGLQMVGINMEQNLESNLSRGCSEADIVSVAPASESVGMEEIVDTVPPPSSKGLDFSSKPFQQSLNTISGAYSPVGLHHCKGNVDLPLQEHSENQLQFTDLYNNKNEKKRCEFSNANNFGEKSDIENPSTSKSSVFVPTEGKTLKEVDRKEEKKIFKFSNKMDTDPCNNLNLLSNDRLEEVNLTLKHTEAKVTDPSSSDKTTNGNAGELEKKKQNTYANIIAPPNARTVSSGAAPDCGVLIERIEGWPLDVYAWAVSDIIGKASISFIGRDPRDDSYILIFVKTSEMADLLVNKGVWVRNRWLNVSLFQKPAIRLTVSGVMPFIPDCLIIEACAGFGSSVYPTLRKIPAAVRSQAFRGAFSFRRELFLIKNCKELEIPEKIQVSFLGTTYNLEVSMHGVRCFSCGALNHISKHCKLKLQEASKKDRELQESAVQSAVPSSNSEQASNAATKTVETSSSKSKVIDKCSDNSNSLPQSTSILGRSYWTQCNLLKLPPLALSQKNEDGSMSSKPVEKQGETLQEKRMTSEIKVSPVIKNNKQINQIEGHGFTPSLDIFMEHAPTVVSDVSSVGENSSSESSDIRKQKKKKKKEKIKGFSQQSEILSKTKNNTLLTSAGFVSTVQSESTKMSKNIIVKDRTNSEEEQMEDAIDSQEEENNDLNLTEIKGNGKLAAYWKKTDRGTNPESNEWSEGFICKNKTNEGKEVLEDWCSRSRRLKPFSKRKLAAQYLVSHPNLEKLILSALTGPGLYKSGSAKYRKSQELLSITKQLNDDKRNGGIRKRRQDETNA